MRLVSKLLDQKEVKRIENGCGEEVGRKGPVVIPGVDTKTFYPRNVRKNDDTKVVMALGKGDRIKRLNYLFEALKIDGREVIDAGAYVGDSILVFNKYKPRRIYAFEPIRENISLMKKTLQLNNIDNVFIVERAVGESEHPVKMSFSGSASLILKQGTRAAKVVTIDNFF